MKIDKTKLREAKEILNNTDGTTSFKTVRAVSIKTENDPMGVALLKDWMFNWFMEWEGDTKLTEYQIYTLAYLKEYDKIKDQVK